MRGNLLGGFSESSHQVRETPVFGEPLLKRIEVDIDPPTDAEDTAVKSVDVRVEDQPTQASFGEQMRVFLAKLPYGPELV